MSNQDDESTGLVLGVVFSLLVLVIGLVLGIALHKSGTKKAAASVPAVAVAATPSAASGPSVKVDNGVVKFYFASGKADVAAGAAEALAEVVKAVAGGKTLAISGFHDSTGSVEVNAELAKRRAMGVRDVLKGLGVAEDKMELRKPEQMLGGADDAEARRVDVTLQ
jgi:outer membrane protein OmpA-like peptidoglycan-associated protein